MEKKKEKKFLKLPQYPGGKAAFQEFIRKNLVYPKDAVENKIEGSVYVKYRVDGLGKVIEVEIEKGPGHGCDEEAARVLKLMRYNKAKNPGLRVIASMRTRINFKLPKAPDIQIEYKSQQKPSPAKNIKPGKPSQETYEYTITF